MFHHFLAVHNERSILIITLLQELDKTVSNLKTDRQSLHINDAKTIYRPCSASAFLR